jgi:hypothetical protein
MQPPEQDLSLPEQLALLGLRCFGIADDVALVHSTALGNLTTGLDVLVVSDSEWPPVSLLDHERLRVLHLPEVARQDGAASFVLLSAYDEPDISHTYLQCEQVSLPSVPDYFLNQVG